MLVGALSHSGRFRAVFCEQMTFGHLAGALHEVLVGLGGTARAWRVDRMATAVVPGTDRLAPQFAQLARHYGVDVRICPAHRPQRKGVVEAAVKFLGARWWRTARAASPAAAQASLESFAPRKFSDESIGADRGNLTESAPGPPVGGWKSDRGPALRRALVGATRGLARSLRH